MTARPAAALLAAALAAGPAAAFDLAEDEYRGPPLSLPQTLRGTVRVPAVRERTGAQVDTLRDLYPALASCWTVPPGLVRLERGEITLRLSLRRDGSIQGVPRVTYANLGPDNGARQALADAALDAVRRCTPVALTPALGDAVAGRPLAVRFVYQGPRGRGV